MRIYQINISSVTTKIFRFNVWNNIEMDKFKKREPVEGTHRKFRRGMNEGIALVSCRAGINYVFKLLLFRLFPPVPPVKAQKFEKTYSFADANRYVPSTISKLLMERE